MYEPVGGSQAVCPYSAITNNSMFFDTVRSEFTSLVYHQSGSPYLSRSKGPDDGLPHGIYNHFAQLTIDEQHFEEVKAEILEVAHACGAGAEKTSLILHTKTETSGGTGAVGSEISSETRDGGTGGKGLNAGKSGPAVPLSVSQNSQAQCRARVGRARKKGPNTRPRCTKQEQKVGTYTQLSTFVVVRTTLKIREPVFRGWSLFLYSSPQGFQETQLNSNDLVHDYPYFLVTTA